MTAETLSPKWSLYTVFTVYNFGTYDFNVQSNNLYTLFCMECFKVSNPAQQILFLFCFTKVRQVLFRVCRVIYQDKWSMDQPELGDIEQVL